MNEGGSKAYIIVLIIFILFGLVSCTTPSSYDLHNKDGSLNTEYVYDMWKWQAKQKKKY